ncbi:hypothetical protein SMICM304S_11824 [Streptomyces microflavus]
MRNDEPGDVAQTYVRVVQGSIDAVAEAGPEAAGELVELHVSQVLQFAQTQVDGERGVVVGREGRVAAVQALKGGIRHRGGAQ